jgi:hypothetical protein
MPDNWIDNFADKTHRQDAQELKDDQRRLHEARVTSEKSREFWEDVVAAVERDVRRFEKDFPHDPKRIMEFVRLSQTCFRLSRADHPYFSCTVEFHPESAAIDFKYVRASGDDTPATGWSGTIVMQVDSNDNLYLNQYGRDFRNIDDVSRMLLEPVFTG